MLSSPPRARPLRSVAELGDWAPGADPFNVAAVSLQPRPLKGAHHLGGNGAGEEASLSEREVRQVIVCHDMRGGYNEDALSQGLTGAAAATGLYSFQQWCFVDQFIFLEVLRLVYGPNYDPPEPASEDEKQPDLPKREYPVKAVSPFYVDKMTSLAQYYGFDGWFFNVESEVGSPDHAESIREFLQLLTSEMHKRIPGSHVQWYDSVTVEGKLEWQDHLNSLNLPFFLAADSIFTNYTWEEDYPQESAKTAAAVSQEGGSDRTADVFTGIDVWGRNTFGGGGFNIHKALRVIARAGTSAAIFAPAWTHEAFGGIGFDALEQRLWRGEPRLLRPEFPPTEDPEAPIPSTAEDETDLGCVRDFVRERASGTLSAFYTNFDRGFGGAYFVNGQRVTDEPWFNLGCQQPQPTYSTADTLRAGLLRQLPTGIVRVMDHPDPRNTQIAIHTIPNQTDAWDGGASLDVVLGRRPDAPTPGSQLWADEGAVTLAPLFSLGLTVQGLLFELDLPVRSVDSSCPWAGPAALRYRFLRKPDGVKLGVYLRFETGQVSREQAHVDALRTQREAARAVAQAAGGKDTVSEWSRQGSKHAVNEQEPLENPISVVLCSFMDPNHAFEGSDCEWSHMQLPVSSWLLALREISVANSWTVTEMGIVAKVDPTADAAAFESLDGPILRLGELQMDVVRSLAEQPLSISPIIFDVTDVRIDQDSDDLQFVVDWREIVHQHRELCDF
ncbi:hypothetical protein HK405_008649, partial [Cladochytrium tenue]